jgi:hypothetical protein
VRTPFIPPTTIAVRERRFSLGFLSGAGYVFVSSTNHEPRICGALRNGLPRGIHTLSSEGITMTGRPGDTENEAGRNPAGQWQSGPQGQQQQQQYPQGVSPQGQQYLQGQQQYPQDRQQYPQGQQQYRHEQTYGSAPPMTAQQAKAHAKGAKAQVKAMRPWYKKKRYFLLLLLVVVIVIVAVNNGGNGTDSTGPAGNEYGGTRPADQEQFVAMVTAAQTQSDQADNDMKRGAALTTRNKSLCTVVQGNVQGWTGKISSLDANGDGLGVVAIEIAPNVHVATWNNALSDIGSNTLIPPGPLLDKFLGLHKNQLVTFGGKLLKDGDQCVNDSRLTLDGKLADPEFIIKFSTVSPT